MNSSIVLVIVGILAAIFLMIRFQKGTVMSSQSIKEKIKAGAIIVDVRTPEEFKAGAYPGAINIPLNELTVRLDKLSASKPVIVYCASGGRSSMAMQILKSNSFTDVTNAGGLSNMP